MWQRLAGLPTKINNKGQPVAIWCIKMRNRVHIILNNLQRVIYAWLFYKFVRLWKITWMNANKCRTMSRGSHFITVFFCTRPYRQNGSLLVTIHNNSWYSTISNKWWWCWHGCWWLECFLVQSKIPTGIWNAVHVQQSAKLKMTNVSLNSADWTLPYGMEHTCWID